MGARFASGSFRPGTSSLRFGEFHQLMDRHRDDIGGSPWRRNSHFAKWCCESLRDHGADDGRDPALAVKHRRSGSTVVDHEAVITLVDFKKRGACEPTVVRILHEPTRYGTQALVWRGEGHDTIFWRKRRNPDCDASGVGNRRLQFKLGQFFSVATRQAPDANRNRLTVGTVLEFERFPLLCGKLHPGSNVCGGDNSSRRLEPRGSMYADQAGLGVAVGLVEISRDTNRRMRQLC